VSTEELTENSKQGNFISVVCGCLLSSNLVLVVKKHELKHKVIGYCANNCNTKFGGVEKDK
jgi:hypothetical protein